MLRGTSDNHGLEDLGVATQEGPFYNCTENACLQIMHHQNTYKASWFKETLHKNFQQCLLSSTDQVAKPDCVIS